MVGGPPTRRETSIARAGSPHPPPGTLSRGERGGNADNPIFGIARPWFVLLLLVLPHPARADDPPLDLTRAVVVAPGDLSGPEKKAVAMLVDEVARRTGVRWSISPTIPEGVPIVVVGREPSLKNRSPVIGRLLGIDAAPAGREGFRIAVDDDFDSAAIVGNDARGVLFGVGRMLRELRMTRSHIEIPSHYHVATAPKTPLRGHQLGYRPKTNSYDGWDLDRWEQYIRDLAIFGTNAIELVPPRTDDDADSPHFPRPQIEMMVGMSRLADEYGIDVWVWYPAMDKDYDDPATVDRALKEWTDVLKRLPRLDAVFVPGGDPGHTRPKALMALLKTQADALKSHHPKAEMWVSPQGFNAQWLDEFLAILRDEPTWLAGVVFGPQVRIGLAELRKAVPRRYPIRNYPDITHTLKCQYPVPDWDVAFALTQDREVINPRPIDQAAIFRACRPDSIGFLTYSEGCNDDVNKFVWSALGWDPDVPVVDILRDFGRVFIADRFADAFAQGLLGLERNWRGPLLTNTGVETTLRQFEAIERDAEPAVRLNWRFQQALYRATYDAYLRDRLIAETAQQSEAMATLRKAPRLGSLRALDRATAILDRASTTVSPDRRARVFELADMLFQSIHMQTSVARHKAIEIGRGTHLDTIDVPLNDRVWLADGFAMVRASDSEAERLRLIAFSLNPTDPGPGGFYDNLGDLAGRRRVVGGLPYADDPDFRRSSIIGFARRPDWRIAWCRNLGTLYDNPLTLRYDGLDPRARYKVRVTYSGDSPKARIRLDAEGSEVHPLMAKPEPIGPVEFPLPPASTADGVLTLRFSPEPGRGGNGRGNQVAEVWIIRAN